MFLIKPFATNPRAIVFTTLALIAITPTAAQTADNQTAPKPEWSVVTVTKIRPDAILVHDGIQKEISAAYKKAGSSRVVLQTLMGDRMEYVSITPLPNWADMDGPTLLARSLGEMPANKLVAKARATITDISSFASLARNDLSIRTPIADPGGYAMVTSYQIAQGRARDWDEWMKTQYVPAMKKLDVSNLWVSQTVFGGQPTRIVVRPMKKLAEIDAGPITRKMDPESARSMMAKVNDIVRSSEIRIVKVRPDLSYMPAPPKE
jgi:hypothetical protein